MPDDASASDLDQGHGVWHLTVPGTPDGVSHALAQLFHGPGALNGLTPGTCSTAEIVLAEVLNNIVEHAYAGHSGMIDIVLAVADGGLVVQTRDDGAALPDRVLAQPSILPATTVDDLPEGGFGWYLIRTLSNDLAYRRSDSCNHLTLRVPAQQ
jgi:serine/threonine-protein kinase RsbW